MITLYETINPSDDSDNKVELNGIFIIPTGLGCYIGKDAAANPQVKLIAHCCKNLIINPNSVNCCSTNFL